jgi:heme oxygenase
MIHSQLKQRTMALHIALETKLAALMSDEITLDQCAGLQKKFYGFYSPVEQQLVAIRGWDEPELQLQSRLKLPLLVEDLASFSVNFKEIAELPLCASLPRLETVAEGLGCLYVLEGSTLGGRIIAGHLKRVLALDETRGCAFFNSYGADVGRMWSRFMSVLANHCENHGGDETILNSACQTFAAMDRWFSDAA